VKIDNSLNPLPGNTVKGSANRSATKADGATAKSSAAPQDSVQLSTLSTESGTASPVDSARVEAIKQAISEGRFKINPEAIADGLIASAKELVAEQKA
jgi:negative regulator of flagellin synthesis FlgM